MLKRAPTQPLDERIESFHAELEAFIESKIKIMKDECPGVPETVLRRLVANRAPNCPCAQAQELLRS
jgi:hypothetical protein